MRVLILGANGFIGRHLSRRIIEKHPDATLTLFSRTISPELASLAKPVKITCVQGDYSKVLDLVPLISQSDVVYHLASASVPATSWIQPSLDIENNLLPTVNLLRLCSDIGIRKFAYISSGGTVYGEQDGMLDESMALKPFSPYGITKAAAEYFLAHFSHKSGLKSDTYRISNAYGPGLEKIGFGVINTWLTAALHNQPIQIFGDGSAEKDYIYVRDAVELLLYSMEHPDAESETFNVSSGETVSLNSILDTIQTITQRTLDIEYKKAPSSDNKVVRLSNKKVLTALPDVKLMSLEQGIEDLWKHLLRQT